MRLWGLRPTWILLMLVIRHQHCDPSDAAAEASQSKLRRWRARGITAFAAAVPPSSSSSSEQEEYPITTKASLPMLRYRARVAYDGSRFHGWQSQANNNNERPTVQGELEQVLSQRFRRSIRIVGAGRTDAGVHARGQAIHFDLLQTEVDKLLTKMEHSTFKNNNHNDKTAMACLERSLNRMLQSQQVRVWNVSMAPPPTEIVLSKPKYASSSNTTTKVLPWHVIYHAQKKLYSYRLCISRSMMDPLERHYRYHVDWGTKEDDVTMLARILQLYVGTHDFRAFAGAIEQKEKKQGGVPVGTVRTVYKAELVCEDQHQGMYRIDFLLKGALYKQVRNMVGTAIDVCRGRMEEETFRNLLNQQPETPERDDEQTTTATMRRRQFVRDDNPCKPAPPQGLTLEHVFFDDDDDNF